MPRWQLKQTTINLAEEEEEEEEEVVEEAKPNTNSRRWFRLGWIRFIELVDLIYTHQRKINKRTTKLTRTTENN